LVPKGQAEASSLLETPSWSIAGFWFQ
jgi:hypothetical protein